MQQKHFNLLANSISKKFLKPGDEILLTEIEHHANIIPWQMVAKQYDLQIKYIKIMGAGQSKQSSETKNFK